MTDGSSDRRVRVEARGEGRIALVTIDRPEVHNALDRATLAELRQVVDALASDPSLLAVVVTGAGDKAFVSGGDLKDLHAVEGSAAARALAEQAGETLSRLAALDCPVIAAIGGFAFGGGMEIALACDWRIAADDARLAGRQVQMGVAGGWGGVSRLVRLVGSAKALRLLLEPEPLTARQALAAGVVDEVVPQGQAARAALGLAEAFAAQAPLAVRLTKRAVRLVQDMSFEQGRAIEAELFASTWDSADHREAVQAFFEKRAPRWQGQ